MIRSALLAATFGLASFALPAYAVPATVDEVMEILRDNGVENLERDDSFDEFTHVYGSLKVGDDDPVVFTTRVMRCDQQDQCRTILMFANFDMGRPLEPSDYETVNGYNESYPFGRAYVFNDEEANEVTIGIDYVVDLEDENAFGTNEVNTFQIIIGSFFEHMMESGNN